MPNQPSTSFFEGQSYYQHEIRLITFPWSDGTPTLFTPTDNTTALIKSPKQLFGWQKENPDTLQRMLNEFDPNTQHSEIIGLCAMTYLHIVDCGLKDLQGKKFPALKAHPPCSLLWGIKSTDENNRHLIAPQKGYSSIEIQPQWGAYDILPPEQNPTQTKLPKSA